MKKKLLKEKILKIRDDLTGKKEKSEAICNKVLESDVFKKAKTVFVFLSFKSEVDTQNIVDECLAQGKKICVPVCKKDSIMDAVLVENMADLVYNKYGILEPLDKTRVIDKTKIDLCIVPGSAFDRRLNRMGYGKGYYDRFLCNTHIKKVALAFGCQIVDAVPVDEYDVKMDCIITENEVFGNL